MTAKTLQNVNQLATAQGAVRPKIEPIGFMRLPQIIGDPKANPPKPALIPISRSAWWAGVKSGRYPKSIKLGPRTTCWYAADIAALIAKSEDGMQA